MNLPGHLATVILSVLRLLGGKRWSVLRLGREEAYDRPHPAIVITENELKDTPPSFVSVLLSWQVKEVVGGTWELPDLCGAHVLRCALYSTSLF